MGKDGLGHRSLGEGGCGIRFEVALPPKRLPGGGLFRQGEELSGSL
jgi:hypothetical protein